MFYISVQKAGNINIIPFKPSGVFYLNSLDRSISYIRGVWLVFISTMFFKEISEFNANSVDPDQMPHSAASDQGLHCLPMSLLWDARLKWVKFLVCHVGLSVAVRQRKQGGRATKLYIFLQLM